MPSTTTVRRDTTGCTVGLCVDTWSLRRTGGGPRELTAARAESVRSAFFRAAPADVGIASKETPVARKGALPGVGPPRGDGLTGFVDERGRRSAPKGPTRIGRPRPSYRTGHHRVLRAFFDSAPGFCDGAVRRSGVPLHGHPVRLGRKHTANMFHVPWRFYCVAVRT